jgi:hypothetical protein
VAIVILGLRWCYLTAVLTAFRDASDVTAIAA